MGIAPNSKDKSKYCVHSSLIRNCYENTVCIIVELNTVMIVELNTVMGILYALLEN